MVTLTKINFYVNDTLIPYTLVQEPYGPFAFIEGHQFTNDSITFDYRLWQYVSEENKDTLIPNVVFDKNFEVLELKDISSHFSLKHGGILNTYDFDYKFYPYIKELYYSYIYYKTGMTKLSEINTDSIIRLINYELAPNVTNEPKVTIYELFPGSRLKQLKKLSYTIDSLHNFIITGNKTIPLKKSEIKTLTKSFESCLAEDVKYSTKTNQHDPFLIEIKLGNYYETIERSEGLDSDVEKYYSDYQTFVRLINDIGELPDNKIKKRQEKYK